MSFEIEHSVLVLFCNLVLPIQKVHAVKVHCKLVKQARASVPVHCLLASIKLSEELKDEIGRCIILEEGDAFFILVS